jgi:hypothetical protein
MELSKKVKIALDETRILILGVQILLGFQLRGVFSDGYEQLPTYVRYLDGLALGLLVCVVGLLIAPGPITASSRAVRTARISSAL